MFLDVKIMFALFLKILLLFLITINNLNNFMINNLNNLKKLISSVKNRICHFYKFKIFNFRVDRNKDR